MVDPLDPEGLWDDPGYVTYTRTYLTVTRSPLGAVAAKSFTQKAANGAHIRRDRRRANRPSLRRSTLRKRIGGGILCEKGQALVKLYIILRYADGV